MRGELSKEGIHLREPAGSFLVGLGSTIFVGQFIAGYWNRLLAQRLRLLHKLHLHEIEQWGGQAMLSDRPAIEGLLEVMERESD
jgi:hypothetical protein